MDGSSMGNLLEGMQAFKKMRKRFYDAVIRMEQKLGKEPEELSEFAGSKNVLNLGMIQGQFYASMHSCQVYQLGDGYYSQSIFPVAFPIHVFCEQILSTFSGSYMRFCLFWTQGLGSLLS